VGQLSALFSPKNLCLVREISIDLNLEREFHLLAA
jgi:hypothetical protein